MTIETDIRHLIARLARLDSAAGWAGDLNPTQRAVLGYLARANRFSRSPSHVAEYLGTTRGTISQSLKSLLQKGYVAEKRSPEDKRILSYTLSPAGWDAAGQTSPLEEVLQTLNPDDLASLRQGLSDVVQAALRARHGQAFGLCHSCIHHIPGEDGAYCGLLSIPLTQAETHQICFEQVNA